MLQSGNSCFQHQNVNETGNIWFPQPLDASQLHNNKQHKGTHTPVVLSPLFEYTFGYDVVAKKKPLRKYFGAIGFDA